MVERSCSYTISLISLIVFCLYFGKEVVREPDLPSLFGMYFNNVRFINLFKSSSDGDVPNALVILTFLKYLVGRGLDTLIKLPFDKYR